VPAAVLEAELRSLVKGFAGEIGVYARRLPGGNDEVSTVEGASGPGSAGADDVVAIAADEIYPTASMVKVPLLVGLMEAVEADELALEDRVVYDDSLFYPSEGDLVNKLRPGEEVSVENLAVQMIVRSDNTASLWIQGLVGGGTVNEWLAGHGFEHTRVNSRVEGRHGDWEVYGWGQSTPREMARLLVMIRDGDVVSPAASDWMYRLLSRAWYPDGATSRVPASVNVASKPGAVSAARSEVLVVNAPAGDYVLCIMTREQEDTSWTYENEGEVLIREVARVVWEAWGG
jgi:beta-lactamase class A